LNFGDTVGIVAPASPPIDPKIINRCADALEKLGFKPKLAANVRKRNGFLAGSDRERAGDLMKLFTDRKVQAIFCVRGGYGAARILPLLDYNTIRANPKIFVGYSDITSLHCALLTQANLISFHGPTLSFHFAQAATSSLSLSARNERGESRREGLPIKRASSPLPSSPKEERESGLEFTVQSLLRTLMNPKPPGSILKSARCEGSGIRFTAQKPDTSHLIPGTPLRGGKATGQLIGGNLSVLCTTLATPYQPSFKGGILFLEDIGEPPYRFDRMLTHLLNAGLLQQVAGIAIGINKDCEDPKAKKSREYRRTQVGQASSLSPQTDKMSVPQQQTLDDVLKERLLPLQIPVVTGLPFGHVHHNATLPVGARVTLDADDGDLRVIQSAVV
jgi:muramoyltetrapeptide carboxypeptidase